MEKVSTSFVLHPPSNNLLNAVHIQHLFTREENPKLAGCGLCAFVARFKSLIAV